MQIDDRWPHIARFLRSDSGEVEHDWATWLRVYSGLSQEDLAAAYLEWADFFEFRLAMRADELARDKGLRRLVERWTDDMAYLCRRSAACALGADPGPWRSSAELAARRTGATFSG